MSVRIERRRDACSCVSTTLDTNGCGTGRAEMTRFAFTVEFDGRPYMGWQRQAHGPSVQQAIEDAIFAVTGERAVIHCAGRTDAGVHGLAMRAHADIEK